MGKTLYLCCAYIPPEGSQFYIKYDIDLIDMLTQDIETYLRLGNVACIGGSEQ